MNTTDLIKHIASHAEVPIEKAERMVVSMAGAIRTTLKKGGDVQIRDIGTIGRSVLAARVGFNPYTRTYVKMRMKRVVTFSPSKALDDALNL